MRPPVAGHQGRPYAGDVVELALDRLRVHVLAMRQHDRRLDPADDREVPVAYLGDVAGLDPAVRTERRRGRFRLVEIPARARADEPGLQLVAFGQAQVDPGPHRADRAEPAPT